MCRRGEEERGNCTDGHISKQITFEGGTLHGDDDDGDDKKSRRDTMRQDAGRGESESLRIRREKAQKKHTQNARGMQ